MPRIKEKIPVRSYSGQKWITNRTNKKYLAKDFGHRCAYCDDLDKYNGGERNYHVEHFAPKEKFPDLRYVYDNLLYACPYCNGAKSDKWPSGSAEISVVGDKGFLDPCGEEYYRHIVRNDDGSIGYSSKLGKYIYEELDLYLKRHKINYNLVKLDERIDKLGDLIARTEKRGEPAAELKELHYELLGEFRELINELQR